MSSKGMPATRKWIGSSFFSDLHHAALHGLQLVLVESITAWYRGRGQDPIMLFFATAAISIHSLLNLLQGLSSLSAGMRLSK